MSNLIKDSGINIAFERFFSVCHYEGLARDMVHRLKYKDRRETALSMAAMMADVIKGIKTRYDIIVPVPASEKRLRKRGYNQSNLIGAEMSSILKIPIKTILLKVKDTPSQVLCNSSTRWYNVKDAFKCDIDLTGMSVLLVDDVITTGATAHYCAEELKARGARTVHVISFAKSIV